MRPKSVSKADSYARARAHIAARRIWGPEGRLTAPERYWASYRRALELAGRSDLAAASLQSFHEAQARRAAAADMAERWEPSTRSPVA